MNNKKNLQQINRDYPESPIAFASSNTFTSDIESASTRVLKEVL